MCGDLDFLGLISKVPNMRCWNPVDADPRRPYDWPSVRILLLIACAIGPLLPIDAWAEDRNDAALWLVNQVAVPLDERFAFHLMVQNRWVDDLDEYQRTVIRPWLSFDWTDHVELAVGYDAHNFEEPRSFLENRAWQRIAYHYDFGVPSLFTHFWLEERFFEDTSAVAVRGRFQIGGSLELPQDFGLVVRNEFFVDLNQPSPIRRVGLGEDHLFVGLSHPLGRWLRVEAGYLMQYLDRPGPDTFNHTFVLGFSATTPALRDLF